MLKEIVTISLCTSGNGNVWVGTYGDGVYLLDNNGRVLRHLTKQQGQLTTNYIFSVRQDIEGDLWLSLIHIFFQARQFINVGNPCKRTSHGEVEQNVEVIVEVCVRANVERMKLDVVDGYCQVVFIPIQRVGCLLYTSRCV